jgi:hypothetical protein
MTKQQHPVTPPPELRQEWQEYAPRYLDGATASVRENWLITRVAEWSYAQLEPEIQSAADRELEACLKWMDAGGFSCADIDALRAARRPSPEPPKTIEVDGFTYKLVE